MGRKRVPGANNRDRDGTMSRERTWREKENTLRPAAEDGGFHVVVNIGHPQGDNSSFGKDGHRSTEGKRKWEQKLCRHKKTVLHITAVREMGSDFRACIIKKRLSDNQAFSFFSFLKCPD